MLCRYSGLFHQGVGVQRLRYLDRLYAVHWTRQARFPFKRNRLRCVRCVNENRKKRKRLRWQAANHGCHRFDQAFQLAGVCVLLREAFLAVFVYNYAPH